MLIAFGMFAVAFVTFLLIAVIYFYPGSAKVSTIPGLDPSDSKEGNFPDIAAAGSLHEFLAKLHADHGPIASFWYGPKFTVSVASPDLLSDLKGVFDRPAELFSVYEPIVGPDGIRFTNGVEGRKRRALINPVLAHDNLDQFCITFSQLGQEVVKKLSSTPNDDHIPLCQYSLALTIKALAQAAFGNYFKDDRKCYELKRNYEICWHEMEARVGGELDQEGSENMKKVDEALKELKKMIKEAVKERQANPPKSNQKAFIDVILENSSTYSDATMISEAMSIMVEGFHTSGYLLAWTLYFIATHTDVEEKLYQEISKVIGNRESVSHEDISKLKYLQQVLNESMRLSALIPWAAKVQDLDIELGGHIIPKGTSVITALGVVFQDETVWPLPNQFNPDRFSAENVKGRSQFAFQPFGLPQRICPGNQFALYELSIFVSLLVRSFKWKLVEGQVVESVHHLVTSPKEEIWVQVEKR
ncbi:cytochrome P450 20A1-like [Apostichopus japonicus]|uniref:cytochrome P450 20A1-like n=1 Tax=Stichopus japonicus TaxID=307972 RepID=UPI003AB6EA67